MSYIKQIANQGPRLYYQGFDLNGTVDLLVNVISYGLTNLQKRLSFCWALA